MNSSFFLGFIGALLYSALFFVQASTMYKPARSRPFLLPMRLGLLILCAYIGYRLLNPFIMPAFIGGTITGFCISLALGYYLHSNRT